MWSKTEVMGSQHDSADMRRKTVLDVFHFRYACKEFDPKKKIPKKDFDVLLETARLSPSSFGLEPWRFLLYKMQDYARSSVSTRGAGRNRSRPVAISL